MNKVFITGLALVDTDLKCSKCFLNLDWIISRPSTFLWSDKIVVTKQIWEMLTFSKSTTDSISASNKLIKLIFENAYENNLIEVVESELIINEGIIHHVNQQIAQDVIGLVKHFPEQIRLGNLDKQELLLIGDKDYCIFRLQSIYLSFLLSSYYSSNCMFSQDDLDFCKYVFGIRDYPNGYKRGLDESFCNVFSMYMPNEPIFHMHGSFDPGKTCDDCKKVNNCDKYLIDTERALKKYFKYREYDEIQQIKDVVNKIIKRTEKRDEDINPIEVKKEFLQIEKKHKKLIKKIFPKVEHWSSIGTFLSFSLALIPNINSSVLATCALFTPELIKTGMSIYSYNNRWINFRETLLNDSLD